MAARGAIPLPPVELVTVLFILMNDPEPEVKATATESLRSLPDSLLGNILNADIHPAIIRSLAHFHSGNENHLEKIALNPNTDDSTIAFLATLSFKRLIEIIANNQERLLRSPSIVDALGDNPLTGRSTIDRILSFLGLQTKGEQISGDPVSELEALSQREAEEMLLAMLGADAKHLAKKLIEEDAEINDEVKGNLLSLIGKMSVFEKIKLAMLGNREARGILVRDRNKIVATAAIRSPKITENEVESFAKSKALCDEVLRIIANNREWTKNYQVKFGLATNPKCSLPTAMKFLVHLQERDLRQVAKSKDVPGPIAAQARRILIQRGKN